MKKLYKQLAFTLALFALPMTAMGMEESKDEEEENKHILPFEKIRNNTYTNHEFEYSIDPFYDGYHEDGDLVRLNDQKVIELVDALESNTYINMLSLSGNNITDIGAFSLSKLNRITNLNLSYNKITEKGVIELAKNKLEVLNLEQAGLQYISENKDQFIKLVHIINTNNSLKDLNVIHCRLDDEIVSNLIKDNQSIQSLALGWGLTNEAFKFIGSNNSLKELYIDENTLTDLGTQYISENKSLIKLNIKESKITNNGLNNLLRMKSLETLYIVDSDITKEVLEDVYNSHLNDFIFLNGFKKSILSDKDKNIFREQFRNRKK